MRSRKSASESWDKWSPSNSRILFIGVNSLPELLCSADFGVVVRDIVGEGRCLEARRSVK